MSSRVSVVKCVFLSLSFLSGEGMDPDGSSEETEKFGCNDAPLIDLVKPPDDTCSNRVSNFIAKQSGTVDSATYARIEKYPLFRGVDEVEIMTRVILSQSSYAAYCNGNSSTYQKVCDASLVTVTGTEEGSSHGVYNGSNWVVFGQSRGVMLSSHYQEYESWRYIPACYMCNSEALSNLGLVWDEKGDMLLYIAHANSLNNEVNYLLCLKTFIDFCLTAGVSGVDLLYNSDWQGLALLDIELEILKKFLVPAIQNFDNNQNKRFENLEARLKSIKNKFDNERREFEKSYQENRGTYSESYAINLPCLEEYLLTNTTRLKSLTVLESTLLFIDFMILLGKQYSDQLKEHVGKKYDGYSSVCDLKLEDLEHKYRYYSSVIHLLEVLAGKGVMISLIIEEFLHKYLPKLPEK